MPQTSEYSIATKKLCIQFAGPPEQGVSGLLCLNLCSLASGFVLAALGERVFSDNCSLASVFYFDLVWYNRSF